MLDDRETVQGIWCANILRVNHNTARNGFALDVHIYDLHTTFIGKVLQRMICV